MSQKEVSYFGNRFLNEGLAISEGHQGLAWLVFSISLSSQAYQNTFFFESPDFWLNQGKQGQELLIPREKAAFRDCEKEGIQAPSHPAATVPFPFPWLSLLLLPSFFSCLSVSI